MNFIHATFLLHFFVRARSESSQGHQKSTTATSSVRPAYGCHILKHKKELECEDPTESLTQVPRIRDKALLKQIQHLQLKNQHRLTSLPRHAFARYFGLQTITVQNSAVQSLGPYTFAGLKALRMIYLRQLPNLLNLPWTAFASDRASFRSIGIQFKEITPVCSCELYWFMRSQLVENLDKKEDHRIISINVPHNVQINGRLLDSAPSFQLNFTESDLYHMPKPSSPRVLPNLCRIKGPDKLKSNSTSKQIVEELHDIRKFLSTPKCRLEINETKTAELDIIYSTRTDTSGSVSSAIDLFQNESADVGDSEVVVVDEFEVSDSKYITCRIRNYDRRPVYLEISFSKTYKPVTWTLVSESAGHVTILMDERQEYDQISGFVKCLMKDNGHGLTHPRGSIRPFIVRAPPLIPSAENIKGQSANYIHFSVLAYPPPTNLTWFHVLHRNGKAEGKRKTFRFSDMTRLPKYRLGRYTFGGSNRQYFHLINAELLVHDLDIFQGEYILVVCNDYGCANGTTLLTWEGLKFPNESGGGMVTDVVPTTTHKQRNSVEQYPIVNGGGMKPIMWVLFGLILTILLALGLFMAFWCIHRTNKKQKTSGRRRLLNHVNSNGSEMFPLRTLSNPSYPSTISTSYMNSSVGMNSSMNESNNHRNGNQSGNQGGMFEFIRNISTSNVFVYPSDRLTLGDKLGEGCFGTVNLAQLMISGNDPTKTFGDVSEAVSPAVPDGDYLFNSVQVAVKCPKSNTAEMRDGLYHELRCLSMLQHENIVQFLGVSIILTEQAEQKLQIIFEFMIHGSLRDLLLRCDPLRSTHLFSGFIPPPTLSHIPSDGLVSLTRLDMFWITHQIAAGLNYLCQNHVVHRDLAARNCLVGERMTVKLSDFGMSRDIYYTEYYKVSGQRCMPVRWMSPEALQRGLFTHAGDIWSLGIVIWEVWTLGQQPWFGLNNLEVIDKVASGETLSISPEIACPELEDFIRSCWNFNQYDRPEPSLSDRILANIYSNEKERCRIHYRRQSAETSGGNIPAYSAAGFITTSETSDFSVHRPLHPHDDNDDRKQEEEVKYCHSITSSSSSPENGQSTKLSDSLNQSIKLSNHHHHHRRSVSSKQRPSNLPILPADDATDGDDGLMQMTTPSTIFSSLGIIADDNDFNDEDDEIPAPVENSYTNYTGPLSHQAERSIENNRQSAALPLNNEEYYSSDNAHVFFQSECPPANDMEESDINTNGRQHLLM